MGKSMDNQVAGKYTEKISISEKIAYGGGDLASNLILVLTSTFVTFFYTDALGLNAVIIGSIMMISRLADGFTDIFMGYLMDRVKTKYGKARPWLLWLSIPIAVACILVFLVPNIGETGKYIYVFLTYNLVTTFLYTMINIPYGALTSLMTRDQNQRTVINIYRMFMAQIGSLAINAFTLPFINGIGGSSSQKSWIIVSVIYGFIAAALFFLCFVKTKERVLVSMQQKETIGLLESFKLIMKNNYWLLIVGIWVCMALGMSLSMGNGKQESVWKECCIRARLLARKSVWVSEERQRLRLLEQRGMMDLRRYRRQKLFRRSKWCILHCQFRFLSPFRYSISFIN